MKYTYKKIIVGLIISILTYIVAKKFEETMRSLLIEYDSSMFDDC